jgi:N-acetylglutamate synthase-like GNAT family acetyltransferase
MNTRDVQLDCVECGQPFVWTANDQQFFAEMGFDPPKRCRGCKARKRAYFDDAPRIEYPVGD